MPTSDRSAEIQDRIERLQRAEEEVRRLQDELIDDAKQSGDEAFRLLREALEEGLRQGEGVEAAVAMVPLVEVLGELQGPQVCALLVDALGSEEPEVRMAAGHALQELAYERFREVAEAVERAPARLPATNPALRELPYVLAEIGEPGLPKILRSYLAHADAEVVASAIEALATAGDPAGGHELRKLLRDGRTVLVEDEQGETQVTLAQLAEEALDLLEEAAPELPAARGGRPDVGPRLGQAPAPPPPGARGRPNDANRRPDRGGGGSRGGRR